MEVNAWWLIAVPVLFGLGWVAARIDAAQWFTSTRQLPESYFKGLNYLLNEQHEQAIAAFEEVARLDPETADLYFALGNLFRRRGETERAIRIHRNLLERADLPESQRQMALFCVAQDYLNAGIFDRAEAGFNGLANTAFAAQAQRELAKLYEKENNWEAALACLQRYLASKTLDASERSKAQEDMSHYACEMSMQHIERKDFKAAQTALSLAAQSALHNPRVAINQAQLDLLTGNADKAYQQLDRAVTANPKLASIAIHTLLAHSNASIEDIDNVDTIAMHTALRWAKAHPNADTIKPVLKALGKNKDGLQSQVTSIALELLQSLAYHIKQTPQQLAAAHLLLAHVDSSANTAAWTEPALSAIESLINRYDKPTCSQCGFKASRHHWRCPGCARWNTLPYSAN